MRSFATFILAQTHIITAFIFCSSVHRGKHFLESIMGWSSWGNFTKSSPHAFYFAAKIINDFFFQIKLESILHSEDCRSWSINISPGGNRPNEFKCQLVNCRYFRTMKLGKALIYLIFSQLWIKQQCRVCSKSWESNQSERMKTKISNRMESKGKILHTLFSRL